MTEIEELVKLILPELLIYFKSGKNPHFLQKELDNKGNTNCNITLPHLECKSSMREVERREYRGIFSSSTTKQNAFTTKPEGQTSKFHINANFAHSVCHYTDARKIRHFSENSEELCDKCHIVVDIATNPSIAIVKEVHSDDRATA